LPTSPTRDPISESVPATRDPTCEPVPAPEDPCRILSIVINVDQILAIINIVIRLIRSWGRMCVFVCACGPWTPGIVECEQDL
jgi:hypothetical protein